MLLIDLILIWINCMWLGYQYVVISA